MVRQASERRQKREVIRNERNENGRRGGWSLAAVVFAPTPCLLPRTPSSVPVSAKRRDEEVERGDDDERERDRAEAS